VLDTFGEFCTVGRSFDHQFVNGLSCLFDQFQLLWSQLVTVTEKSNWSVKIHSNFIMNSRSEFDSTSQILKKDEKLQQYVAAEVCVAQLQLKQLLTRQVLGEVLLVGDY
jgi:hypothetical protein